MNCIFHFGEYSLSQNTQIKLENYKNLSIKSNLQPPHSAWNSLFKVEKREPNIQEEKCISMDIDEYESSQNFASKDCYQESMLSSQFIITQVPKRKLSTANPEDTHQKHESKLMNSVELLYEILEDTNRTLNENDLKDLSYSDIDEIMEKLSSQLSLNGVYNLCNSLCYIETDVIMQYVKPILSKILLPRIIELDKPQQATKMIPIVVGKLIEKFPEDVHKWIFIPMINSELKDSTVLSTIIKCYSGHQKIVLINDFLTTVNELKIWHTTILPSMIDTKIEENMKDRLLTLLVERALALSKDKNYSKFILSFIKLNSPFTISQKRMLEEIVVVNETIFKASLKQILHNT